MKKWLPTIIMCVFIFWLSSLSGQIINNAGLGDEKVHRDGHLIMFLLLGASLYYATGSVIRSLVFAVFYAITDELHQLFTPWRSASMFDVYVDSIGAFGGIFLWKYCLILWQKLKSLRKC